MSDCFYMGSFHIFISPFIMFIYCHLYIWCIILSEMIHMYIWYINTASYGDSSTVAIMVLLSQWQRNIIKWLFMMLFFRSLLQMVYQHQPITNANHTFLIKSSDDAIYHKWSWSSVNIVKEMLFDNAYLYSSLVYSQFWQELIPVNNDLLSVMVSFTYFHWGVLSHNSVQHSNKYTKCTKYCSSV